MGKHKKKVSKAKQAVEEHGHPEVPIEHDDAESQSVGSTKLDQLETNEAQQDPEDHNEANSEIKALHEKIANLKLQLSSKGAKDEEEDSELKATLAKVQEEKTQFENQYNSLLSRLSSMKSVFNKMRESQEELESCQEQLREYESQNLSLRNKLDSTKRDNEELQTTVMTLNQEISALTDECETLSTEFSQATETSARLEKELQKQASDHLVEKNNLDTKIKELELLLSNIKQDTVAIREEREDYAQQLDRSQRLKKEAETNVAELERQLENEIQKANSVSSEKTKRIESLESQLHELQNLDKTKDSELSRLRSEVDSMMDAVGQKEALQQECKEKVLQIGKLRHEAIILNEHLTKALAMLRKSSDSENVDKELISNLLISFVAIPRADPKKFEVLELISSFLNWDDDKKQQAGLISATNGQGSAKSGTRTQNFVSLWTEFLEKESET